MPSPSPERDAGNMAVWVGLERNLGDAADGGQGLAPEAQRVDVEESLDVGEFAGGVAGKGQGQIVGLDAAAVVHHLDQVDAALGHLDINALAAGINGVFEQFLDNAGGPLNDLAGGDLVDQGGRQLLNAKQGRP